MQNKLQKSIKNNFITLLNFIVDPAVIVDGKGKFRVVNDAFIDLTGLSKKELIGTAFLDIKILAAESKATLLKNLMKRMKGLPVEPYEISFTDRTGRVRYVEVKAKKIDRAGQTADLVIFRDITRRKDNARRLKGYSEKMEALVNEKVKEVKESAQKLKESEEKHRKTIVNANVGIIAYGPEGKVNVLNPKMEEMTGFKRKEIPTLVNWFEKLYPNKEERRKVRDKWLKRMSEEGEVKEGHAIITTKEGKRRNFLFNGVQLESGDSIAFARDITERKKAEEKLRKSEKSWSDSFNSLEDVMVIIGKDHTIEKMNDSGLKLVGKTREEVVGKKCYQVIYDRNMPCEFCSFKRTLKTAKVEMVDIYAKEFDKYFSIKSSPISNERGEIVGFVDLMRDITQRKKVAEALRRSEEEAKRLLEFQNKVIDTAVVWVNLLDLKGNVILWNRAAELVSGYSREEVIGHKKMWEWLYPDPNYRANIFAIGKEIGERGKRLEDYHSIIRCKDGSLKTISWYATNVLDEKGKPAGSIAVGIDVTERKEMEEKLRQYSEHLEELVQKRTEELEQTQAKLVKSERLATMGELAAMVGHDLRNPLTGIMGAAYYLKTKHGTEVSAKGKEMLETIEKAINYSNKIINDLLEYSRDLKLKFTETTPKAMLQRALSLLEVPEKIQVVDATENEPMVKADTEKIRQVFVNIIQNATDVMPEGGTLTIKSRKVKGKLEIAFKDTGTGMSEETLSALKGGVPLFTTKAKGMGFGLPICKRIVEAHGGKICVESTAGKGTKVTVTIPVNPEPVNEGEEKWIFNESLLTAITTKQRTP
jgi:PAS domain S-box-containing protein